MHETSCALLARQLHGQSIADTLSAMFQFSSTIGSMFDSDSLFPQKANLLQGVLRSCCGKLLLYWFACKNYSFFTPFYF